MEHIKYTKSPNIKAQSINKDIIVFWFKEIGEELNPKRKKKKNCGLEPDTLAFIT